MDFIYHKVASSRWVYNSILELFGHRSQYISIKFPLHKHSALHYRVYKKATWHLANSQNCCFVIVSFIVSASDQKPSNNCIKLKSTFFCLFFAQVLAKAENLVNIVESLRESERWKKWAQIFDPRLKSSSKWPTKLWAQRTNLHPLPLTVWFY